MLINKANYCGNLKEFPLIVSEISATKEDLVFMCVDSDFIIVEMSPEEFVCLRRCEESDKFLCKINKFPATATMNKIDNGKVVYRGDN
jgi:hypothetical protein